MQRLTARLRQSQGSVTVWLLLLVIPLVVITDVALTYRSVRAAGDWVQNALNRAAKAAAWQIPAEAYASDAPYIDPAAADLAFRRSLAENLNLNAAFEPLSTGSRLLSVVGYELDVINGPFPHLITNDVGVDRTFSGPAVVATIQIQTRLQFLRRPVFIRKVSVAEVYQR